MAEWWVTLRSRPALSGGNREGGGGATLPSRLYQTISTQILPHEALSCCAPADRHLRFCWLETSWDDCQRLSLGSEILSWEKLARMSGLCQRLTVVMHILEQEVRQGWTGAREKAYSHIFHWYQSHVAGFHEIVEAVHCIWLCLIEEMWMDVFCGDDVQYITMKRMYSMFRC